jgi:hypothetical protein
VLTEVPVRHRTGSAVLYARDIVGCAYWLEVLRPLFRSDALRLVVGAPAWPSDIALGAVPPQVTPKKPKYSRQLPEGARAGVRLAPISGLHRPWPLLMYAQSAARVGIGRRAYRLKSGHLPVDR